MLKRSLYLGRAGTAAAGGRGAAWAAARYIWRAAMTGAHGARRKTSSEQDVNVSAVTAAAWATRQRQKAAEGGGRRKSRRHSGGDIMAKKVARPAKARRRIMEYLSGTRAWRLLCQARTGGISASWRGSLRGPHVARVGQHRRSASRACGSTGRMSR